MHIPSQTVYDFLLALSSFHPQLLGWDQQQWLALPTWHLDSFLDLDFTILNYSVSHPLLSGYH